VKDKPLFEAGFTTKNDAHQGLGLFTVKSITEHYKGTIQVNVEAENRITFYIRIPH
jgi:sensor histidine kinase regulating citrate/malate metabolism